MSLVTSHRGATVAGAILLTGICLAGCTGVTAAKKLTPAAASGSATAGRALPSGKALVDSFAARLQSGAGTPFEADYFTAGRASTRIVYAVRPPGELLFKVTPLGKGKPRTQIVVNQSGEYRCVQRGTGHVRWTCRQLSKASAAVQHKAFDVYTAAHWAAFLKTFVPAAGAKVTTFTTSLNVAGLHCLDFSPPGTSGVDVICAAAPGVLGLVTFHVTSFMIESLDSSPPASLFQLPPGAKVTRLKAGRK